MMKGIILFCILFSLAVTGIAQKSSKNLLAMKAWKISSDEMSGLGIHTSLNKDTELQFFADGSWKSSHPIKSATQGNWRLENNDRTLVMVDRENETKYYILKLTENEFEYRLKKNAATYLLTWASR